MGYRDVSVRGDRCHLILRQQKSTTNSRKLALWSKLSDTKDIIKTFTVLALRFLTSVRGYQKKSKRKVVSCVSLQLCFTTARCPTPVKIFTGKYSVESESNLQVWCRPKCHRQSLRDSTPGVTDELFLVFWRKIHPVLIRPRSFPITYLEEVKQPTSSPWILEAASATLPNARARE